MSLAFTVYQEKSGLRSLLDHFSRIDNLVSAFATTSRLVLVQTPVAGKSNELLAFLALSGRLAERDGLKGAPVSIAAIAADGGW